MCPVQISLRKRRVSEIGIIGNNIPHDGSVQHRAGQLCRGEPRRLHQRLSEIGGAEDSPGHLSAVKHGTREIAFCHPGLSQVGQVEIGSGGRDSGQDCAAQLGAVEGGVGQVRARQVGACQVRLLKIRALQVTAPAFLDRACEQIGDLIRKDGPRQYSQGCRQDNAHFRSPHTSKGCIHVN